MENQKNILNRLLICFPLFLFLTTNLSFGKTLHEDRPRLILTPSRIAALKSSISTTHQHLWKPALESADKFSREEIPEMSDAHNKYRRIGDTMPVLGLAFLMTGDECYVEAAQKWLFALLEVTEWKGSGNLGRSAWTVGCALLYDWLYDVLDEEIRSQVKKRLLAEAPIIIETAARTRALSNHLLIETTAIGMVGMVLKGEADECEAFLNQADAWAMYIINHAPLDGSWGEGVQYWQYGLGYFLRFLEAAKTSGYKDYYPLYEWLKITGFFPIHFSLPERPTEVINFSDCGSKRYIPAFLLYLPASKYRNGYFQDYGNRIQASEPHKFSWLDFIYYDPNIKPINIYNLPTLHHFSDHDFVTMRSDWNENATVIGFRCGPAPGHRNQKDPDKLKHRGFGPGHQHPDINSFCLFSKGQWLAIDPGYTHLKKTDNHNTLIVNGYGQAGEGDKWLKYLEFEAREPAPAVLRVESNPVYDYVLGDAGNIYVDEAELKSFRRHLLFLKPDIVIIADNLEGKEDSRFEWLLNTKDSIVQKESNEFEVVQNGIRLWVHPILPENYKSEIKKRRIKASDVKNESDIEGGQMTTLDLEVEQVKKTQYLVVLCALKDKEAEIPGVTFKENRLKIFHNNNNWLIRYVEKVQRPDDPVLIVEEPKVEESYYNFVRD